jgi:glycosyltransferase involved in cell wall biosynthesis
MTRVPVLWLIKGLDRGGAERLVTLMAPRIDRRRYDVEIAYLLPSADGFVEELRGEGVSVTCLGAPRSIHPSWPQQLRAFLRERRFAIVHTHSPLPAAVARLLARRPTQLVHTEHNLWGVYRWPTYAANATTYSRNAAVLAVSDGVAASIGRPWWARFGSEPPVETLHHGVALDQIPRGDVARTKARASLGLESTALVIGNVANFSPKKDHLGLLAAIDEVRRRVPATVLLLIGSGPLEREVRAAVADRGLDGCVRFLGSRADVTELLPALDAFVLGSRFEGLPIALLEAMAAEVACVATAVGGIPEAMRDGVEGRLVPPADPGALADALVHVLVDPKARGALAAAGRERVADSFSIDRAVERTEHLYDRVLRARRSQQR